VGDREMTADASASAWDKALAAATREYERRHRRSGELMVGMARSMPGGDTRTSTWFPPFPPVIESARGAQMRDADGNELVDLLCNYTSLVHGHCASFVMDAVESQLRRGFIFGAPNEAQGVLAAELCRRLPGAEKVRFTNSGTEAGMLAARLARAHTGRTRCAVAEHSYHGSYEVLEWSEAPRTGTVVFPVNDRESTEQILDAAGPLAAIYIEPVLGSGGIIAAHPDYLAFLRDYATRTGAVLVFDEVMTFRLGYGGRQGEVGVTPDLTTMGKIIGGGFAIGAVAGRDEIMSLSDPHRAGHLEHHGTWNGHRLTMVAGAAALGAFDRPAVERLNRLGDRLAGGVGDVCAASAVPVSITSCGSMLNLHAARDVTTPSQAHAAGQSSLARYLHLGLINHGVFLAMRGEMALCTAVDEAMIDRAVEATAQVLAEAESFLP
jgi:glutamate-1-semialdehyde 2,1-aminomutase